MPVTESGCWIWMGSLNSAGYGQFNPGPRLSPALAHVFCYEINVGRVPDGLELDHLCRVRCCVNPDHLEPVTRSENCLRSPTIGRWKRLPLETCKYGHEMDYLNTAVLARGERRCKECHRERNRLSKARVYRRRMGIE